MNYKYFATLLFGLASVSLADNPISNYHYHADPAVIATDDTFYLIADVDDENPTSGGDKYDGLKYLYAFSTKDMQNWTDHGMILSAGRDISNISAIWASGIAIKDGVFYIVHTNGGGVGIVASKNIDGPYKDPANGFLVGNTQWGDQVNCGGIEWCFDPAIFVDDDGKSYLTYGGGNNNDHPYGNNFRMYEFETLSYDNVKLNKNSAVDLAAAGSEKNQKSFEASYLHKRNGYYYLSFSSNGFTFDYAMSRNIKGPYTYQGTVVPGVSGNNHAGFAKFKDKWYVAYHERKLFNSSERPTFVGELADNAGGNHRSTSVDEVIWNGDKMNQISMSTTGPKQIANFDPYQQYKALTSSKQRNVRSRTAWTRGKPVTHILLPLSTKESWIRVTGVDFKGGASKFTVTAGSPAAGNKVEVRTGSATGSLAGTCNIKQTSSKETYAKTECEMNSSVLKGVIDQLFLVFKGSADSTMGITHWEFTPASTSDVTSSSSAPKSSASAPTSSASTATSSSSQALAPRSPFDGKYVNAPGKIEAENFDVPGEGDANQTYYDRNEGNQSCVYDGEDACSHLREDTDVDLKKNGDGIVVGVFETDEWLEYSVYAAKGGSYTLYVAAVSETGGSLKFTVKDASGKVVSETDDIVVGESGGYDEYGKTTGATVTLAEGVNIIRMTCTKQYLDVDYFNLVAGENAADDAPIGVDVEPSYTPEEEISSSAGTEVKSSSSGKTDALGMHYMVGSMSRTYNVYDMQGVMLGKVQLDGVSASEALNRAGFRAGRYILCNKYNRLVVNAVDRH